MSTVAITFADELRSRADDDLATMFKARPDLVSPVPNDFSALAARATSTPSLVRVIDSLNLWHYQIIEAACALPEPFKKSELIEVTGEETSFALDYLWQIGLLYKEGNNFRTPTNLKLLIGEEPAGLGPVSAKKISILDQRRHRRLAGRIHRWRHRNQGQLVARLACLVAGQG